MYICQCAAVSDTSVTRAVDAGATTLAQVCRLTGAGRDCGMCVFSVKHVMRNHQESECSDAAPCLAAVG
ncbi:MAG TPA: (2Fe-2S)-binding protein [Jatrophihabitantaceae bacterium]|jgi:bacterioferritin-associated ferredoxin